MHLAHSERPATAPTVNRPYSTDLGRIVEENRPYAEPCLAARKLAAQFGLTLSVAIVIAALAGLGGRAA